MGVWHLIESILAEDRKFRGDTFVTYADLVKLFVGSEKSPGITGMPPDKRGGVETGKYRFDPTILALGDAKKGDVNAWHDDLGDALARATTDSTNQIQGGGMGGTMVKGNWGAKVGMQYAPKRPHHNDRLGSSMDRYDVVMMADIDWVLNRKGVLMPVGILTKIAWAPSMGSQAEREQRLQDMFRGAAPNLPRRPMADRPVPPRQPTPDEPEVSTSQGTPSAGDGSTDPNWRPNIDSMKKRQGE